MDLCGNDVCTDSSGSRSGSYQRYDERLTSFDKWPVQMKQSREDMAAAGFVYSNCGDRVHCFSCHIKVRAWNATDDPWTEHEKWSPSCPYIQMVGFPPKTKTPTQQVLYPWDRPQAKPSAPAAVGF